MISDTYVRSTSSPLHGCWLSSTSVDIQNKIGSAFEYVFRFANLGISSHKKKENYQGDNNSNRGPLDFDQVYHDIPLH